MTKITKETKSSNEQKIFDDQKYFYKEDMDNLYSSDRVEKIIVKRMEFALLNLTNGFLTEEETHFMKNDCIVEIEDRIRNTEFMKMKILNGVEFPLVEEKLEKVVDMLIIAKMKEKNIYHDKESNVGNNFFTFINQEANINALIETDETNIDLTKAIEETNIHPIETKQEEGRRENDCDYSEENNFNVNNDKEEQSQRDKIRAYLKNEKILTNENLLVININQLAKSIVKQLYPDLDKTKIKNKVNSVRRELQLMKSGKIKV